MEQNEHRTGKPRLVPITMGSPRFRTAEVGGLSLTHAWFPAGAMLHPHEHERPVLAVMLTGSFELSISGRWRDCEPDTVFSEPAGERHANRIGTGGAEVMVVQPSPTMQLPGACLRLLHRPVNFRHGQMAALGRRLRGELASGDSLAELGMEGIALEMLALASRQREADRAGNAPPEWLGRVVQVIHDRYLDNLSIEDVAREADVHPAHVARVFRSHYHVPLATYMRRLRLDWAAARLLENDVPLATLALRAGFADQSHFTRAFRRHTGLTPGRFRRVRGR